MMSFQKIPFITILGFLLIFACADEIQIHPEEEDWSFVAFGDVRNGYGIYAHFASTISKLEPTPKFAICLGDIVLRGGNEAVWENFWRRSKPLTDKMPLYFARGNHEENDEASNLVFSEQTGILPDRFYYSFSWSSSFFIILDSFIKGEENSIGTRQFKWLNTQLDSVSALSQIMNVFVFLHHPVFPQGKYRNTNMNNAEEVHNLFKLHPKIKAVIVGHDHLFNKYIKDDITYITSGGGGSPLHHGSGGNYYHFLKISFYEKDNRINVKTFGLFNEINEDFDL